jgi:hypothetical protein
MPCHAGRTISGALRQPIGQSATGPKLLEQARDVVAARPAACAALDAGHRQLADVRRSFRRWASGQLSGKWPVAVVAQGCTLGNLPSLKRCPLSCFDPEICAIGRPPQAAPDPPPSNHPSSWGSRPFYEGGTAAASPNASTVYVASWHSWHVTESERTPFSRMLRVSQPFANHTDQMIMAVAMTTATFTTTKTAARKVSRFASDFRFRGSGRFVGILEP